MARLKAARARGRKGGRPKALDKKQRAMLFKTYDARQHSVKEMCEMFGISKPTLYNYLRERDEDEDTDTSE